jgi:aryl-alcohol dehydrogenase-like predicted oxidoreductase
LAYGPSDGPGAEEQALDACLAAGVDLIDTAAMYSRGTSELRVGEVIRGRGVIVATKFPPALSSRTDDLPAALQSSLARLGRERIELYQHHYPSQRVSIPTLMGYMADAVEAGRIMAVGVSNYSAEQMRLAHKVLAGRGIPLASNQVQYSLLHRSPEVDGVLDTCRELGVTLIAYMPLASGALSGKYATGARPSGLFRRFMPYFRGKGRDAVASVVALLREIGERHGKTPAQVALRWLIEDVSVLPIPGAKNAGQAAENVGALSFSLTQEEREELAGATQAWTRWPHGRAS